MGRSSHRSCSTKISVLKNFAKTPVLESLVNKVVVNFIKKRFQHRCFPVNIAKFLRIPISKNIYKRLLLMRLSGPFISNFSVENDLKSYSRLLYNTLQRAVSQQRKGTLYLRLLRALPKSFCSCFGCGRKDIQSSVLLGQ